MITQPALGALREFTSNMRSPVISLYLDVDGGRFPSRSDYEAELSSLISNARRDAGNNQSLTRDHLSLLDDELEAISRYITLEFERNSIRSLAIFSCRPENLWHVVPLNINLENRIFIDFKPHIAPLAEIVDKHGDTCVLLTNKETARIFNVTPAGIVEHPEIFDAVSRLHDQGGWKQDKLQRRHHHEVQEHLKNAAEATLEYFKREGFGQLMVGVADELWPELERALHPYLRERLAGRFTADIKAPAHDIFERTNAIIAATRERENDSLLSSLAPELSAGKVFVGGLDDVLAVLNQRRVDLLVVEKGYREKGKYCYSCDSLAFAEETCPSCLDPMEAVDVVEEARELAVRQGARVVSVPAGHPALAQAGRIAARLRY